MKENFTKIDTPAHGHERFHLYEFICTTVSIFKFS